MANESATESRILLTFDRALLMRKKVIYGYIIRSKDPALQLVEVLTDFAFLRDACMAMGF
ncbi:Mut7-C RNAse domain-containing protein [Acetobacterium sp.]|uniref:Mut7-C RNAse domain-containing protein n=1 Tax=Acetobacterium sp. TaxID=1872094 RepID=UPI0039C8B069